MADCEFRTSAVNRRGDGIIESRLLWTDLSGERRRDHMRSTGCSMRFREGFRDLATAKGRT